ncbi:MAG TPA: 4-hydroxythreonine-4-phosphate dehydrogenase PdxA [Gammaproteobacteria bacterium]|nr:4-hydroxythreonine-4-phosphate dehydrogenase PdxA [Gammaproteobacteria bacterium]
MNRHSGLTIALTPGEPAGIGPDLTVMLAQRRRDLRLIAVTDPQVLADRARRLGLPLTVHEHDPAGDGHFAAGELEVRPLAAPCEVRAGRLDTRNAVHVLDTLREAATGCLEDRYDGMVTCPVHKGVINDAGVPFSGHTEFLAELTGVPLPVMMLVAGTFRVALATTHLPLRDVPDAIDTARLEAVCRILDQDLRHKFGVDSPRILVAGLNPHAGEGGHLGREEIDVIEPVIRALREQGLDLIGPLPADTLFTPSHLEGADATLAMYHDQGLPVLKFAGFGRAVNITLGLPIVRTSVDHGTALDLAGTGNAEPGSLEAAVDRAAELAATRRRSAR